MPKVSVIVSAYKNGAYIKKSFDSILSQTLKDIEVVVVYRTSTDGTIEILKNYAAEDSRIKLIEQLDTKGCGPAKNLGIKAATGEYITFMDCDDYYVDSDCLEKLYDAAKAHAVKICGGFRSMLGMDGNWIPHALHRAVLKENPDGVLLNYRDWQFDYHFHSYLYERKMIVDNNIRFGAQLTYDDISFHVRAMLAAGTFFVFPTEIYCYRLHGPYIWNYEQTCGSVLGFMDVLRFSKENNLAILHWKTVRRMTAGEYHDNFMRHLDGKNMGLYALLLKAQNSIDNDLIESVQGHFPEENFFEGCDLPSLGKIRQLENGDFVLESLLLTYRKVSELDSMLRSCSYRLGKAMTFVPRKIKTVLRK